MVNIGGNMREHSKLNQAHAQQTQQLNQNATNATVETTKCRNP